jgi:hypothetical protein
MLVTVLSQRSFAQTFSATLKFYLSNCGSFAAVMTRGSAQCFANDCGSHSHFFNLKIQYGTTAAATMATSASG